MWDEQIDGDLGFNNCRSNCKCDSEKGLPPQSRKPKSRPDGTSQEQSNDIATSEVSELYPKGLLSPLGGLACKPSPLFVASSTGITLEKVTLTVDSGASDTVIPANMLAWIELMPSPKVGTEYEVANGKVVHNLGEKKCIMKITEKA